jgi:hypothetical protein
VAMSVYVVKRFGKKTQGSKVKGKMKNILVDK